MATEPRYKIGIVQVYCEESRDDIGADEVYFIAQADGGLPVRYPSDAFSTVTMSAGSTWTINNDLQIAFDNAMQLTLYEQDIAWDLGATDYVGNCYFAPSSTKWNWDEGQVQVTNGDHNTFTITFEWLAH